MQTLSKRNVRNKNKNIITSHQTHSINCTRHQTNVEVSEHNTRNFSKGVIYCNNLREIEESVILQELKQDNVIEVKKILKKQQDKLQETGLIILTFASINLPADIKIGYQNVNIRPYVPLPIRCRNCGRIGHPTKYCKSEKMCLDCGIVNHKNTEDEKCTNTKSCINCKENKLQTYDHSIFDRNCPTFIKNKEIQAIRTIEKTSLKEAHQLYNERHKLPQGTYASTTKLTTQQHQPPSHEQHRNPSNSPRKLLQYEDSSSSPSTSTKTDTSTSSQLNSQLINETKLRIFHKSNNNSTLTTPLKSKNLKNQKNSNNTLHNPVTLDDESEMIIEDDSA